MISLEFTGCINSLSKQKGLLSTLDSARLYSSICTVLCFLSGRPPIMKLAGWNEKRYIDMVWVVNGLTTLDYHTLPAWETVSVWVEFPFWEWTGRKESYKYLKWNSYNFTLNLEWAVSPFEVARALLSLVGKAPVLIAKFKILEVLLVC